MFLEFDNYFVNLAKVDFIGEASEKASDDVWDLYIYMEDPDSDPILFRSGFIGLEHAKAFRQSVIRFACTTGLATGEDLDRIFLESMPGPSDGQ